MGCVYRPKGRSIWMIKYRSLDGRLRIESSKSAKKEVAKRLLRNREHTTDQGALVTPDIGKLKFSEAVEMLVNYHVKHGRNTKKIEGRIAKHLAAYFGPNRLMVTITGDVVDKYIKARQAQKPVRNATINRELAWLKQMFTLAIRYGKLLTRPHIELLPENNARQGFFEPEQIAAVIGHLPGDLRPVVRFAYITGWRMNSEVLTREWRHVDLKNGSVCLLRGETKNDEPRIFHFTSELRTLLEAQHAERERLKKQGLMTGFGSDPVFFRMVAEERGGKKFPQRIRSIIKAFKKACKDAGYPGRIPHDLRRSAVRTFVRRGISTHTAMKLSGHKTESVFRRYDIISDDDLRDAAAKLDASAKVG
jgi:integrase